MRQFISSFTWILMLVLCASCELQIEEGFLAQEKVISGEYPQVTITAFMEGGKETRTTLGNPGNGNYRPYWKESDEIAVYDMVWNSVERFSLQSGAGTDEATFIGLFSGTDLVGLYPYSCMTNDGIRDHVLTLEIPAVQQYAPGTFGDGAYPMLAVGRPSGLVFKNLCAILQLSMTGTDAIETIRFRAHDANMSVSGRATVRTDFDAVPELLMQAEGFPEVTLQCGGVVLRPDDPTDFFLVIPPGTYKGGFELEILSKSGRMIRSTNDDISFKRSQYRTIPAFVFVPEIIPFPVPEIVDLGLSVKWASFNLGASKPEEYGDYYAWGETEPHYISQDPLIWKDGKTGYDWDSYKWGMWSGGAVVLTKYSPSADYGYNGYTDGKTFLDPEDDAAHVNLGGNWRMPTWDELNELRTNCSWEWTVKNGVNGRLVTGPNGNSIFLPAASDRYDTVLGNVGLGGYYRSSSLKIDYPTSAYELVFDKYGMYESCSSRSIGFSIRPVYAVGPETKIETIIPTNIGPCSAEIPFTITTTESIFGIGIIYSTNKFDPVVGNLGDGNYSMYYTSDISKSQIINELKPNTTYFARAFITVDKEHGPIRYGNTIQFTTKDLSYSTEYVDLGLSVKWATCNLGSVSPGNVGGYYRWGETEPTSLRSTYKWSGSEGYTKYNADDGKVTLDASDDAATVNLGSGWRMPTNDEITELRNKCTWTQTTRDGIQGCLVTGPNRKSIFIPVSRGASVFFSADIISSELNTSYDGYIYAHALSYHFDVSINYYASVFRYSGTPIRPVYDEVATTRIETHVPTNIGPCSAEIPYTISTTESLYGTGIIYSTNVANPEFDNYGNGNYLRYSTPEIGSWQIISELKPNTTYFARAFVTIGEENGPIRYGNTVQFTTKDLSYNSTEYVDLGLSVKWATCNLGSVSPGNVGGYYRWGETEPTSLRSTYKWSGSEGYTKYNADDGKVTLDASDDAATVNLGSGWRMPTNDEITELRSKCTWALTTRDGVMGCTVTGPNGRSIFIPVSKGHTGYYNVDILSSSLSTTNSGYHRDFILRYESSSNSVRNVTMWRTWGTPIRPVFSE